ncbi:MAG: PspA/IM30 family protein [Fimbriimonadaceae bacterium]|nr:PspA/IM30 family protein [Chthonomonadaceae bacterium]MCO5298241.1 PspA/IM30 family protein [Fimbriimonadaceae bacterium]
MGRFFRWLKALFNRGMDKLEDPEMMLDQAKRDMQQTLNSNREKAVQAITQKNRLQMMVDEATKKSEQLESQATMALRQGNRDLARQFIREKANVDATLGTLQGSLVQATQAVEAVKLAIKRQEEETRKKTAEALAMKAQWKQAQIQNSISKALEGLTFENQLESFGAAADRIRDAQSEAAARQEMMASSIQGKVIAMEDQALDYEAEEQLQKLEERLGMRETPQTAAPEIPETVQVSEGDAPVPSTEAQPDVATPSEIDSQLSELEKRIQSSDE